MMSKKWKQGGHHKLTSLASYLRQVFMDGEVLAINRHRRKINKNSKVISSLHFRFYNLTLPKYFRWRFLDREYLLWPTTEEWWVRTQARLSMYFILFYVWSFYAFISLPRLPGWRGIFNPHQNDQGWKVPCFFKRLIALKCLKCQKI